MPTSTAVRGYAAAPMPRPPRRMLELLGLALAACATPRPVPRVLFPFWSVRDAQLREVGCSKVVAWISKSAKTGVGASVQVSAPEGPCPVSLAEAFLELEGDQVAAVSLPPGRTLAQGDVARAYVPFLFDNEESWNRGVRQGTLVLRVTAGAARGEVRLPMVHRHFSFLREPTPSPTPGRYEVTPLEIHHIYPPEPPKKPAEPAPAPPAAVDPAAAPVPATGAP